MLTANVAAVRFLLRYKVPVLYQIHERPPEEKLPNQREFLAELWLSLPGDKKPIGSRACFRSDV
jgi:ribonuclease R